MAQTLAATGFGRIPLRHLRAFQSYTHAITARVPSDRAIAPKLTSGHAYV
jgi:hypothetical protein